MSTSGPEQERSATPSFRGGRGRGPAPSPVVLEFDFGTVLAHGQTLRHEFLLTNPLGRPLRIIKAVARTPCCSAIRPLPASIPAGGRIKAPVELRVGRVDDSKRVEFAIETDSIEQPIRTCILTARMIPEWGFRSLDRLRGSVHIGESARGRFQVVSRRQGNEGRPGPLVVTAREPLMAVFTGPESRVERPDGIIETTRDVAVTIARQSRAGFHQGSLTFRWPGDVSEETAIAWEVVPRIKASPPGLVIRSSGQAVVKSITVTAVDQPFRITKVTGPVRADGVEVDQAARKTHLIRVPIEPSAKSGQGSEIRIETDHPDQPVVTVSVLILPGEEAPR